MDGNAKTVGRGRPKLIRLLTLSQKSCKFAITVKEKYIFLNIFFNIYLMFTSINALQFKEEKHEWIRNAIFSST